MSQDFYQRPAATTQTGYAVDAGLQAHMRSVYNTMGIGLAFTGLVAWMFATVEPLRNIVTGPLYILFALAPLGIAMFGFTEARMQRWPVGNIRALFYAFSAIMGISMSTIFLVYTADSIARVFFITAATFAATSLFGYTTKKDLTGIGSFLVMGLIGIVIASVVNMFLQSSMMAFITSAIGVFLFTGLAAWETQRIKESYSAAYGMAEANAKIGVLGALGLYLNFINLFHSLLHFFGNRE